MQVANVVLKLNARSAAPVPNRWRHAGAFIFSNFDGTPRWHDVDLDAPAV
jgi:hypothetical protein